MSTTQTETPLERQVREEQEAHDAQHGGDDTNGGEPITDEETGQTALVDRSQYEREDLQIAKVDGNTIDRISLKFSGEVFLNRSDPSDVAVYNALRLGRDVGLLIDAKCGSTMAKGATDREGDLDVVVGTKGLKVHSISKPAGADWVTEADA